MLNYNLLLRMLSIFVFKTTAIYTKINTYICSKILYSLTIVLHCIEYIIYNFIYIHNYYACRHVSVACPLSVYVYGEMCLYCYCIFMQYCISPTGMYTTAGEISPSNSVSSNKLQDYIPVLIILPILLITLASVMIIAVIMVTAKLK